MTVTHKRADELALANETEGFALFRRIAAMCLDLLETDSDGSPLN
jgi:hypothetical protein